MARRVRGVVRAGIFVASALCLLPSQLCAAPPRGYQPRACGFDMDRDGRFGEPEDCRVCDGATADPDGDGIAEDMIYIDCGLGADSASCGAPNSPCRTIRHAYSSRVDGPADGAEDILCFRGTCTTEDQLSPPFGGVTGFYTVAAAGSEVRGWRYPANPTMLAGWDSDGDHSYPPFDTDDLAVIDGTAGRTRLFRLNVATDDFEMGHFKVVNYGRFTSAEDTGFLAWGPNGGLVERQFFHDLELVSINQDRATTSFVSMVNLFPVNAVPQWLSFENWKVTDNGQWFARGSGYDNAPDMGPFRFQNISRTAHSCDFAVCGNSAGSTAFKLWGYLSGVEILDSVWDANVSNWQPKPEGGPSGSTFVFPSQCTRDWMVRNNAVLDYKIAFNIEGVATGFCENAVARSVDEIRIDGNWVVNTYEPWRFGDYGVRISGGGDSPGEVVEDVYITNNVMESATGWEADVWSYPGHATSAPTGRIVIASNTFWSNVNRHGGIVIGNVEEADENFPHQRYVIQNNVFGGLVATNSGEKDLILRTTYPVSQLVSDFNVFDATGEFIWNDGARLSLAGWRSATGKDASSRNCTPLFVDPAASDRHLQLQDTCAKNAGLNTSFALFDLDLELRPQLGAPDIGADEIAELLFADGFESGNVSRWSSSVP
jgi:hypothetical protein